VSREFPIKWYLNVNRIACLRCIDDRLTMLQFDVRNALLRLPFCDLPDRSPSFRMSAMPCPVILSFWVWMTKYSVCFECFSLFTAQTIPPNLQTLKLLLSWLRQQVWSCCPSVLQ
jgi:hypothetical protein